MKKINRLTAALLTAALSVTVMAPHETGALTVEYDGSYGSYRAGGLTDGEIAKLDAVSVTDREMLDDIVERSYHNDFQTKRYIVKTEGHDLDTAYWRNYVHALGDAYISISWYTDGSAIETDENSYFSINMTSRPANAPFDTATRTMKRWEEYDNAVKRIEDEIGILNPGLCDYQKIQLAYIWIKDNVEYGTIDTGYESATGGSDAIEAVLDKHALCAGYSRIFNRFMHDCNINSYWVSLKNMDHAHNLIEFQGKYHAIDLQTGTIDEPDGYENLNQKQLLFFEGGPSNININTLANFYEYPAIKHYNNDTDIVYCELDDGINCFIYSCPVGIRPEITTNPDGTRHFLKEGEFDEYCDYCQKVLQQDIIHEFDLPAIPAYDVTDIKTDITYPSCTSNGTTEQSVNGSIVRTYPDGTTSTETLTPLKTAHSYSIDVDEDAGVAVACENCGYYLIENNDVSTTPGAETSKDTTPTESMPQVSEKPSETINVEPVTTKAILETTEPIVTTKPAEITTRPPVTTTRQSQTTKAPAATVKKPSRVKPAAKNIKKKSIKLTWKSVKNAKKYQIQWAVDKKFKKKMKSKTAKKLTYTIKKLTRNKTYYVRVRGVNGKAYGKWSKVKKVKIRK